MLLSLIYVNAPVIILELCGILFRLVLCSETTALDMLGRSMMRTW